MVLSKDKKTELLEEVKGLFKNSAISLAADYSGLKGNDLTSLRKAAKEKGIRLIVTKNSLVRKALGELELELNDGILDKPVVFAFGDDEVEVSKEIFNFTKEHESLEILGGIVRSQSADSAKIKVLAMLPSREELYAKVVGSIAAPMSGFVNVLAGNIRGLVSVLNQYAEKLKVTQ